MTEKHLQGVLDRELQQLLLDDAVDRADVYAQRQQQPEASARFGELLVDPVTGELRSYASLIEPAVAAGAQLELNLTQYARRAEIRRMLADKIEREVVPIMPLPWISKIPEKLRNARKTGTFGVHAMSGRGIVLWDDKASLSRLCPDDAREEASRLQKRYQPMVEQAWKDGCDVHSGVFTMPNFKPGDLAAGMKKIFDRFRALIKKVDRDGNLVFPEIEGALVVLEAPLGRYRDWNVHLNVFLIVRGFLDYGKLRRDHWHWDLELKRLPRGNIEHLQKAFRELVKYAVLATSEKSEHHAARDSSRESSVEADLAPGCEPGAGEPSSDASCRNHAVAPPMLAWTPAELTEWLMAMHGFRRTRSYGCLYGAPKPESTDLQEFVWLGSVRWRDGAYRLKLRLLDSIPEDKSGVLDALERWKAYKRRVIPPPDDHVEPSDRFHQPLEELLG